MTFAGIFQSTDHPGSKRGARHRGTPRAMAPVKVICSVHGEPEPGCVACKAVIQQRRGREAAPPPQAKIHRPLPDPAPPLSSTERMVLYLDRGGRSSLTPAQRRRVDHKLGHAKARGRELKAPSASELPAQPAAVPPASLKWSARARKALGL